MERTMEQGNGRLEKELAERVARVDRKIEIAQW